MLGKLNENSPLEVVLSILSSIVVHFGRCRSCVRTDFPYPPTYNLLMSRDLQIGRYTLEELLSPVPHLYYVDWQRIEHLT